LIATATGTGGARSLDRVRSGKYYWECTFTTTTNASAGIGTGFSLLGSGSLATCIGCINNGQIWSNGTNTGSSTGGTVTRGWVCCIALDATNNLAWFRNGAAGNWNGSAAANPATGAGGISFAAIGGGPAYDLYALASSAGGGGVVTANFGATAYTGTAPAGFGNLPTGTAVVTNEVLTQLAVEEWAQAIPPPMQATQIAIEEWVSNNVTNPQMIVTQVGVEMWASIAEYVPPVTAAQIRAMILA